MTKTELLAKLRKKERKAWYKLLTAYRQLGFYAETTQTLETEWGTIYSMVKEIEEMLNEKE